MQRKYLIILGATVLSLIGFYLALDLLKPNQPPLAQQQLSPSEVIEGVYADAQRWQRSSSTVAEADEVLSADELYKLAIQDLPSSLKGTRMDGSFRLDSNGRLVVEPSVVRIFEYFMSTIGEDSLETIISRVKNLIEAALPDTAKGDAHLLLAQYLDYRHQQGELMQNAPQMSGSTDELRETFEQVKQMRRDIFGADHADSLFEDEESYMAFSLNSMELNKAGSEQTELENIASLRELAVNLPESHKKVVEEQLVQRELDERTALLKQDNASAEELREMREQLIGTEAAERLGTLDIQREQWQQRVDSFKQAYQQGLSTISDDASDEEKQDLMQSLLDQHAESEPERKRMKAMLGI